MTYIYIVGTTDNPVKIGMARSVTQRLAGLQTGCPDELLVLRTIKVPGDIASKVEAGAHALLAEHHRRGEWFNVDMETASAAIVHTLEDLMRDTGGMEMRPLDKLHELSTRLSIRSGLSPALLFYREILADPSAEEERKSIRRHIQNISGVGGITVFRRVVEQDAELRKDLFRQPRLLSLAERKLAEALNALIGYHKRTLDESELDNSRRNVA